MEDYIETWVKQRVFADNTKSMILKRKILIKCIRYNKRYINKNIYGERERKERESQTQL